MRDHQRTKTHRIQQGDHTSHEHDGIEEERAHGHAPEVVHGEPSEERKEPGRDAATSRVLVESDSVLKNLLCLLSEPVLTLVDLDLTHETVPCERAASPSIVRLSAEVEVLVFATRRRGNKVIEVDTDVAELVEDVLKLRETLSPEFTDGRQLHGDPVPDVPLVVTLKFMLKLAQDVFIEVLDTLDNVLTCGLFDRLLKVFNEIVPLSQACIETALEYFMQFTNDGFKLSFQ